MTKENFKTLEGVDTINALANLYKDDKKVDDDFLKGFGEKLGINVDEKH